MNYEDIYLSKEVIADNKNADMTPNSEYTIVFVYWCYLNFQKWSRTAKSNWNTMKATYFLNFLSHILKSKKQKN